MCVGSYDDDHGHPEISATVVVPTAPLGHEFDLLLDTGADSTCLSGIDAARAGLTPEHYGGELTFEEQAVQGVTETTATILKEPVVLGFEEYSDRHERWSLQL